MTELSGKAPKTLVHVHNARKHWVGDAFYCSGMFLYDAGAREERSPFLALDYMAPKEFEKNTPYQRNVGLHPHRGFETVTLCYSGGIEHHDTKGGGGVIGPEEVQWMTAGSGLEHEEYHSVDFAKKGGTMEMLQLWVNLPASHKMTKPRYQAITRDMIPEVTSEAGRVRIVAGEFAGTKSPTHTFTPLSVLDVRLNPDSVLEMPQPDGWTTIVVVQDGEIDVNGIDTYHHGQAVVLSRPGEGVTLRSTNDEPGKVLFLSGEPIDEPVVGYGPFVMNTPKQIQETFQDYHAGRF